MLREVIRIWLGVAVVTGWASGGLAAVYKVNDLGTLRKLVGEKAEAGDVIEIQPGRYYLDVPYIHVLRSGERGRPITIRGIVKDGKPPVIDASRVNVNR